MNIAYPLLKKFLFQFDPELVHDKMLDFFSMHYLALKSLTPRAKKLATQTHFLKLPHPIGLAAGFDKNALALDFLSHLGFGAIEVGTVTLKPQLGNAKPRIWRHADQKALRNALGFPSLGADFVLNQIKRYRGDALLGINIGKNKETPNNLASLEYATLYNIFSPHADYLVINISSPNTEGLRDLQEKEALEDLLKTVCLHRKETDPPLYLKISPNESLASIDQILETCLRYKLSGIIATNTTKSHPYDRGGYSGEPLYVESSKVWKYLLDKTRNEKFDIIAVGGFSKVSQIQEYFDYGGKALQVYTSFIYQGPGILSTVPKP